MVNFIVRLTFIVLQFDSNPHWIDQVHKAEMNKTMHTHIQNVYVRFVYHCNRDLCRNVLIIGIKKMVS
jgi:hypothetical protein